MMAGFQRILVPVDFSDGSRQAVLFGSYFAARSNGSVHLLNIVADPGMYLPDASMPVVVPSMFLTEAREAAEQELAKLLVGEEGKGLTVTREAIVDSPVEGIVRKARQEQADLICIGTHGRTGFSRLALGSVAERTVQRAPCPILVARGKGKKRADIAIRRIAVAIDFSDFSPGLLHLARQVAIDESVQVDLVHVVEEYSPNRSEFSAGQPIVQDYLRALRSDAEKQLLAIDIPGVRATRHVLLGRPFVEINRHAAENRIDLIIIGTHGRTGLRHWFLGSVAEMVVRKAPCPVLVMPQNLVSPPRSTDRKEAP